MLWQQGRRRDVFTRCHGAIVGEVSIGTRVCCWTRRRGEEGGPALHAGPSLPVGEHDTGPVLEASARVRLSIGRTRNRLTPGRGLTKFNGDRSLRGTQFPPAVAVPGEMVNAGYAWPRKGLVYWTSSPTRYTSEPHTTATGCTSEGNGGSRASWALTREAGRTRGPIRGFGRHSDYTTYRTVSQAGLAQSGASH